MYCLQSQRLSTILCSSHCASFPGGGLKDLLFSPLGQVFWTASEPTRAICSNSWRFVHVCTIFVHHLPRSSHEENSMHHFFGWLRNCNLGKVLPGFEYMSSCMDVALVKVPPSLSPAQFSVVNWSHLTGQVGIPLKQGNPKKGTTDKDGVGKRVFLFGKISTNKRQNHQRGSCNSGHADFFPAYHGVPRCS